MMIWEWFEKKPTNKEIKIEKAKFNLWQKVWVMNNNTPECVRIVSVRVEGVFDPFKAKSYPRPLYKVTSSGYYSAYHGVDIDESRMFESKEELIKSIS